MAPPHRPPGTPRPKARPYPASPNGHRTNRKANGNSHGGNSRNGASSSPSNGGDCDLSDVWFTPDPKYPTAGAEFVIISVDKVAFGVSEFAVRQSNTLWHQAANLADDTSPVFGLEEPFEHADALRLLLDVIHGHRLPSGDDDAWPAPGLFVSTLLLARKYEFTVTYSLLTSFAHNLVDRRGDKSRHLVGVFRVAAVLDDAQLAAACVSRIADEFSSADVDIGGWTPDLVAGVPTAYLWAFMRAVRARRALGANESADVEGASVENVFRSSLQAVKAQETQTAPKASP